MFIDGWLQITQRYLSNPWVAGLDLRNEIRMNEHGQMAAWGNGKQNDWAIAATRLGNMLLQVNPDALIIVEGILSAGNLIGKSQFTCLVSDLICCPSRCHHTSHHADRPEEAGVLGPYLSLLSHHL